MFRLPGNVSSCESLTARKLCKLSEVMEETWNQWTVPIKWDHVMHVIIAIILNVCARSCNNFAHPSTWKGDVLK